MQHDLVLSFIISGLIKTILSHLKEDYIPFIWYELQLPCCNILFRPLDVSLLNKQRSLSSGTLFYVRRNGEGFFSHLSFNLQY